MQLKYILRSINNFYFLPYLISIVLLIIAIFIGISIGSLSISFFTIVKALGQELLGIQLSEPISQTTTTVIMSIRLPRVILAFIVGSSLALSGAAFQGLLKNPLADPYTLGVSSGASVGAVLVLFLGINLPFLDSFTLPVSSIIAGFFTLVIVLSFAKLVDKSMSVETIILTGIIFSSFLGSVISLMIALTGDELRQIISWLMGSVSMRGWEYIKITIPFYLLGAILLLLNGRELNALSFGEESAGFLGVNVPFRKYLILLGASLLTGASVAVSGTIGFVGLVVPHITRITWGANHTKLMPLAMLNGGTFLVIADLVARTIISPRELPIGVITALIGAPIFGLIFFKRNRRK